MVKESKIAMHKSDNKEIQYDNTIRRYIPYIKYFEQKSYLLALLC